MSELRRDLVSGDWIIIAPERARRPHLIVPKKKKRAASSKKDCPFEDLKKSGNWPPILSFPKGARWTCAVIKNKYPALTHLSGCAQPFQVGPHLIKTGVGQHDLVVTRNHYKNFGDLPLGDAASLLGLLQKRYKMLAKDLCNFYTSTFFNWGQSAGASIFHPHYQVLTLPIVPPDVSHSLEGSRRYFAKHRRCVHCVMLAFDMKDGKRIIDKNSRAVALAPFVSRVPFESRVFPLAHSARFENTPLGDLRAVAGMIQSVLKRMKKYLNDPDLNFFIHTAPLRGAGFGYYHWHVEVVPKISNWGGFELGTGVDINVVDPESAASVLKGKSLL